eukprot:3715563-Rhodomonas_salina.2
MNNWPTWTCWSPVQRMTMRLCETSDSAPSGSTPKRRRWTDFGSRVLYQCSMWDWCEGIHIGFSFFHVVSHDHQLEPHLAVGDLARCPIALDVVVEVQPEHSVVLQQVAELPHHFPCC